MIANYHRNVSLRLIRNPLFRQWSPDAQPQGFPDVIEWRFRRDDLDTLPLAREIERRQADIVPRLVPPPLTRPQLATLRIRYPSQLHFNTTQETNFFFLNTRVPPFNNLRIRQAVNKALNRGAFVRELGPGYAATCQIVPPEFPGYRHYCPPGTGSGTAVEEARRVVRSSGATGAHVTVWVIAALAEQGRSVVALLDELGFQATLKPVAPVPNIGASYFRAIFEPQTKAQIGFYAWAADFPSETGFMPQVLSCAAFANGNAELNDDPSEFCDPAVDRLFARATNAMTNNPTAATALWQRAEQMVLAQAPFIPTYNPENVAFLAPNVGDFEYNPEYGVLLGQLWVR
ncbi:MAG TPA: ABC transporter substrate-binding protein [Gaiellaceae bacterium]|nr:ABC transporter substrate-binding protein [Gaiellaceae bacterium]